MVNICPLYLNRVCPDANHQLQIVFKMYLKPNIDLLLKSMVLPSYSNHKDCRIVNHHL